MTRLLVPLMLGALLLSLEGCALHSPSRSGGTVTLVEDTSADDPFVIKRRTIEHAMELGPAWFIRQLSVRPIVTRDERFFGFQLMSLFPGRQDAKVLPIRAGDIVQRVNGQSIERPDQFMAVWQSLSQASHLSIQLLRGDQPLLVTWVIEGSAATQENVSALSP